MNSAIAFSRDGRKGMVDGSEEVSNNKADDFALSVELFECANKNHTFKQPSDENP